LGKTERGEAGDVQGNVSDHIRVRGGLGELYSQQEVLRAGGILRTNSLTVEGGKAIYPTFSFLSHSCVANGRYVVMDDNKVELRAKVDIKEGEEITIQYITFIFGNVKRRRDIQKSW